MINPIPNEDRPIAMFRGQTYLPRTNKPGDPAIVLDGERVPYDDLDQRYKESMLFDWHNARFVFLSYQNGRVSGSYSGGDSSWARQEGLQGSPYDGWTCDVAESEIENLRVERLDLLES